MFTFTYKVTDITHISLCGRTHLTWQMTQIRYLESFIILSNLINFRSWTRNQEIETSIRARQPSRIFFLCRIRLVKFKKSSRKPRGFCLNWRWSRELNVQQNNYDISFIPSCDLLSTLYIFLIIMFYMFCLYLNVFIEIYISR